MDVFMGDGFSLYHFSFQYLAKLCNNDVWKIRYSETSWRLGCHIERVSIKFVGIFFVPRYRKNSERVYVWWKFLVSKKIYIWEYHVFVENFLGSQYRKISQKGHFGVFENLPVLVFDCPGMLYYRVPGKKVENSLRSWKTKWLQESAFY